MTIVKADLYAQGGRMAIPDQGWHDLLKAEPQAVIKQLDRILASPAFRRAQKLSNFLHFVVTKALAREVNDLKETNIAVQIYGRAAYYDPKADPIVRTEARRLRRKLDEYYANAGPDDTIYISLPVGGYCPQFHARAAVVLDNQSNLVETDSLSTLPTDPKRFPIFGLVASGLLAIPLIVMLLIFFLRRPHPGPQISSFVPVTSYPGSEFQPTLSPDGSQVAFVWNGSERGKRFDLYVKKVNSDKAHELTDGPGHSLYPAWSPDGKQIAFIRWTPAGIQELRTIPANGGPEHTIAVLKPGLSRWNETPSLARGHPGPSWSPDGKQLAVSDACTTSSASPDCLFMISVKSGERKRVSSPPQDSSGDSFPRLSPDGTLLAFIRSFNQRGLTEIFEINLRSGAERRLTQDGKTISALDWLGADRVIFVSNRSGGNMLFTMSTAGGSEERIDVAGRNVGSLTTDRAGSKIVYSEGFINSNVWTADHPDMSRIARAPVPLLVSSGKNDSAQFSSNGKKIVFISDRSGTKQIWLSNAEGGDLRCVTSVLPATPIGSPRLSSDQTSILFDSTRGGHSVICLVHTDGSGFRVLAEGAGDNMMPSWSRDGRSFYFIRKTNSKAFLLKQRLDIGDPVHVATDPISEALESPDGARIYYYHKGGELWEAVVGGSKPSLVSDFPKVRFNRYFAIADRGLYFVVSGDSGLASIRLFDITTRQQQEILQIDKPLAQGTPSLSVSPDGRRVLFSQVDSAGSDLMMLEIHK